VPGDGAGPTHLGAAGTSDLAVAVSTLLVAASFGTWRRRVQYAVDRRFFRRRVDRQLAAERFALRLRDEVSRTVVVDEPGGDGGHPHARAGGGARVAAARCSRARRGRVGKAEPP
jgi:hypothetical protein